MSDTHGLFRPELAQRLRGVDRILHAGDVGDPLVLTDLEAVAPVTAVWGNVDGREVREETRETALLQVEGVRFAVAHGHQVPSPRLLADRFPEAEVVVHGHTHRPSLWRAPGGALVVNPGSAGPERGGRPASCAVALVENGRVRIRHLEVATGRALEPEPG